MPNQAIFTIGYEGSTADMVLWSLENSEVEVLVDVRWRPASRKSGLSKTPLGEACAHRNIAYVHERHLGTPPEIMKEFRETGYYDWDAYQAFLATQYEPLAKVQEIAAAKRICLLCYEADPAMCHRRFVAAAIGEALGIEVRNLKPVSTPETSPFPLLVSAPAL